MELSNNRHVQKVRSTLVQHVLILGSIVAALWMIEMLDLLIWGGELDYYGIQPRTLSGLRNIFVSPILHAGIGHLFTNTLPFLILGWFIMLRSTREFFFVTAVAVLVSGLGIWIFGASNSIHLGISGVVFGYLGYLLCSRLFRAQPGRHCPGRDRALLLRQHDLGRAAPARRRLVAGTPLRPHRRRAGGLLGHQGAKTAATGTAQGACLGSIQTNKHPSCNGADGKEVGQVGNLTG